ncbi:MAG: serine/threonine protein kinase [Sandaracinaceae bacterium]|nr:serine/threonine protein kinase [Sandaracinaceae bacterium]
MSSDRKGRVLAKRYQLVEVAGEGGMATVWRALTLGAQGFQRPVAIKRIRSVLSRDPLFIEMFVEEARVGSGLDHPNIVQIHDFGRDEDGEHFLVMEWVEGLDLRRWSRSHKIAGWHAPWHLVTAIAMESLRGLHAAHQRTTPEGAHAPAYHRDVTPGNVLLGINGAVKLADFGLSRAMDRARITQPQMLKGKLAYLAPELIEDAMPSAQSDLFSLGAVLWEVLTGRSLFHGRNDVETLEKVAACHVPDLAALRPDLPPELSAAIHRSLAREPGARFPAAQDMARALAQLLKRVAEPTDAEPIGASVALARHRLGVADDEPMDPETRRARNAALLAPPDDRDD